MNPTCPKCGAAVTGAGKKCSICGMEPAPAQKLDVSSAEQRFNEHTQYVSEFLQEMWAVLVDPCEQPKMTVAEMCKALLDAAKRDRELAATRSSVEQMREAVRIVGLSIEEVRQLTLKSWPQTHSNPPDVEEWRTVIACLIKNQESLVRAVPLRNDVAEDAVEGKGERWFQKGE